MTTYAGRAGWMALALGFSLTSQALAQGPPPLVLARPEGSSAPPLVVTLQDAIERARKTDAQFQSAVADVQTATGDREQARASLLPSFGYTAQYLGTKGDTPLATGRFVSNDGVKMYRSWLVAHEELTAGTFALTPLHRAEAAEAAATAKLEIARRGLTVTVTDRYYALVTAERKYATAQQVSGQAQRFRDVAQQQLNLGQVARADLVKAEIAYQQQLQAYQDAALRMETARLALAVMLFPTLNENFTVVDDLTSAPALPEFAQAKAMAEQENPDLRAATALLSVAQHDVTGAKQAFLPTLTIDADYGIEANEFALHSVAVSAPELGVLPNLGYFVTVNLSVPIWDWGGRQSKVHQTRARETQAQAELTQAQRQLVANLFSLYNEATVARSTMDGAQRLADLAAESLRLTNLRYQAGESTALEVVDAQNTFVQARDQYDAALARYRVSLVGLQTVTGVF